MGLSRVDVRRISSPYQNPLIRQNYAPERTRLAASLDLPLHWPDRTRKHLRIFLVNFSYHQYSHSLDLIFSCSTKITSLFVSWLCALPRAAHPDAIQPTGAIILQTTASPSLSLSLIFLILCQISICVAIKNVTVLTILKSSNLWSPLTPCNVLQLFFRYLEPWISEILPPFHKLLIPLSS